MQGYDNWRTHRDLAMTLYLSGKTIGEISGRTGIPKCRLAREITLAIRRDPQLEARHLKAKYPSQRRRLRFPGATIVVSEYERTVSRNEY